ncbi:MAG: HAMP domain-containing histidine kinase, partial [Chloroflexi bacterium]|nr:HAMP domain-containing histidine kinase [Chloroflexota bacterium]
MGNLPRRPLLVLISAVWLAGMMGLAYLGRYHSAWSLSQVETMVLVLGLVVLAGFSPIPVAPRVKAGLTTAPLFTGALLLSPGNAALIAVVGSMLYQVGLRDGPEKLRLPWFKYPFNAGEAALSTGAASLVFSLLTGSELTLVTPAVLAAAGVMYLLNSGLVATAAALQQGMRPHQVWWTGTRENGPAEVALYSFGLLGAVAINVSPWLLPSFLLPVSIIYIAFSRLAKANTRLEDALATLRELQGRMVASSKLASVGALSLDLSHQLKNPLFILTGRLESLQRRLTPEDPARRSLETALQAAWRIQELISNFLGAGRGDSGILDPHELVDEAIGMAQMRGRPTVKMVRLYGADLPPVQGNRVLLQEALSNIVANALEASPRGEEVTVQLSRSNGALIVRVSDKGGGIPQEQMGHLFEPFNSSKPGGLGLGLFAAKHIVEMHKGEVMVESNAGEGTSVTVRLVAAHPEDGGNGIPHSGHSGSNGESKGS